MGSQKVDYITYLTNVAEGDIKFGCDTKIEKNPIGDLPIIIATNDYATHRVTFSINPELSVDDFPSDKLSDTAKVWIKAGNIKKYLDVSYDVTPYFKVDPVDIVIYYDQKNPSELTKVVNFSTNLGGIQFPSEWSTNPAGDEYIVTYAQSTINIKCDNTKVPDGKFTITATTNPGTTTTHTFTVKSLNKINGKNMEQQIRVTVRPPADHYIIYMRAINDLVWCKGDNNDDYMHSLMLGEDSRIGTVNNNWRDGWWEAKEDKGNNNWQNVTWNEDLSPHPDYHYVYIYTQIGETDKGSTSENVLTAQWLFGGLTNYTEFKRHTVSFGDDDDENNNDRYKGTWWPGRSMKADGNNPGWYYYSIAVGAHSVAPNKVGTATEGSYKIITPGQTLLIFSNGTYLKKGFQSHRFTHHNDPGITLFNYEDNEGWYLYDPTADPYYRVYDEKPTVVDVEYTIYTKRYGISGWYVKYGVADGGGSTKFEMKSDNPNVENEFKCTECGKKDKDGNTWYKTILHLKAPLNEYAKVLHVKIRNTGHEPELFDGDNYPSTKKNGNRYVVEGSYDPDKDTWTQGAPF